MLILTIRTENPEAELALYQDAKPLAHFNWQAHRELAETIHVKIRELLGAQNIDLKSIQGLVIYKGPGSFTGLRIGFSVANGLADSLDVPIVSTTGDTWQNDGVKKILAGDTETIALPEYGSEPHITTPKK